MQTWSSDLPETSDLSNVYMNTYKVVCHQRAYVSTLVSVGTDLNENLNCHFALFAEYPRH
jgi:hypothetical protein